MGSLCLYLSRSLSPFCFRARARCAISWAGRRRALDLHAVPSMKRARPPNGALGALNVREQQRLTQREWPCFGQVSEQVLANFEASGKTGNGMPVMKS